MRPEMKAEAIKKEGAALGTRIEKTRYIPDISIQANYLTTPNISFLPQNVGAVGVLLTWQPWDWGQKRHNIAQKLDAEKQAAFVKKVHDAAVKTEDAGTPPKRPFILTLKELTMLGYFTSEPGATQVLQYNPVPGAYKGCIPVSEAGNGKTWAT